MLQRTQIALPPELHRLATRRAADLGLSFAEYVRRLVAEDLVGDAPETTSPERVFNLGSSTDSVDVSKEKDQLVAEAITAQRRRR